MSHKVDWSRSVGMHNSRGGSFIDKDIVIAASCYSRNFSHSRKTCMGFRYSKTTCEQECNNVSRKQNSAF